MENFNSQIAEEEAKAATNQDKRDALIKKLILGLRHYEQNPDEVSKNVIIGKEQVIADLKTKLETAISDKNAAESIAEDALKQANEAGSSQNKDVTAVVKGKTYVIEFGVDGLTKEQLKEDSAKLETLVEKGSQALKLKED